MTDMATTRKWRPWSPEDDMVLKQIYPSAQPSVLVSILGRSIGAIRARASFLNRKRSEQASSLQRSKAAMQRRDNADAVVYQPVNVEDDSKDEEVLPEALEQYKLLATMKSNADVLRMCGMPALASLTDKVFERIEAQAGLEFLTVHGGL